MTRRKIRKWGVVTPEIKATIEEYGREYLPAVCPPDIGRGPTGYCFDWCAVQASINRKYRYVEGIAYSHTDKRWVLHAWLTDGIHAFDPTWAKVHEDTGKIEAYPTTYAGIEMPIEGVAAFMKSTGYQGLLGNRWRAPDIVDRILEGRYGRL